MIRSFADKTTEMIFSRELVRAFPADICRRALRKLVYLNAAKNLEDLRVPPSNRLEKKEGKWKDFYAIRVTDKYRITFRWVDGDAYDVWFGDYHDRRKLK